MRRETDPVSPSLGQVGDFLLFLFHEKKLSVSAIKGYRSALASSLTFSRSKAHAVGRDPKLSAMIAFFARERPIARTVVPKWNLTCVLWSLTKPPYEPFMQASLLDCSIKTAFLLAFASAKRSSELHAFSGEPGSMLLSKDSVTFYFVPGFYPKTQVVFQMPDPVVVPALPVPARDSIVNKTLCPVRAVKLYLKRTRGIRGSRSRFFIPVKGEQELTRPTVARWIKSAISSAYSALTAVSVKNFDIKAHEVRAVSTSWAFHNKVPLASVMQAAAWRSHGTFSKFYLRSMTAQRGIS